MVLRGLRVITRGAIAASALCSFAHKADVELLLRYGLIVRPSESIARGIVRELVGRPIVAARAQLERNAQLCAFLYRLRLRKRKRIRVEVHRLESTIWTDVPDHDRVSAVGTNPGALQDIDTGLL